MKTLLLAALLLASPGALAQVQVNQEPLTFDSPEQQERFNKLTEELRCLVCQNQNLADSDAPLAHDLRDEIHKMIQSGKGNDQIKAYLVERYGDFVLYRPPLKGNTLLLWLAPALLLGMGTAIVVFSIRKRARLFDSDQSDTSR